MISRLDLRLRGRIMVAEFLDDMSEEGHDFLENTYRGTMSSLEQKPELLRPRYQHLGQAEKI